MSSVADVIRAAATRYGLDPDTMTRIAHIESRLNPAARNPNSSAAGLFQFVDGTWGQYGRGDRFDATANTDAAMRFTGDNIRHFRAQLGRDPTPGETYLLHQQGRGGAVNLLRNPNALAESVVGRDAVVLNGGRPGMTAGEFASLWTRKMGDAPAAAGPAVAPSAPPAETPAPSADDGLSGMMAAMAQSYLQPSTRKTTQDIRRGPRSRFNLSAVS